ncbi:MAG TPA: ATP-dependent DNA helicase [Mycobacteriales bacterium]|nr:ATP-dependent DNA helicase [Mycobacteriales bacterium]
MRRDALPDVSTSSPAYRLVRPAVPAPRPPELDVRQRSVVDHVSGPLLVLAGPGTGKTTTLVEAVAARIQAGIKPDEVLMLTFSRKAADELRERITTRVARTVSEPSAHTFHGFCHAVLRAYGDGDAPRLLSGAERDVRVRELLRGNAAGFGSTRWPAELVPALSTRGFARDVADVLDRARERGLDGEAIRRLARVERHPGWEAAGSFLEEYLDVLDQRGELDYAGLVGRAAALLSGPAAAVADRYRAVYVDEYQDTDPSQERLVRLLAGGGRLLVAVGDPDQSIYGFRGAEPRCLVEFPERFRTVAGERARVITLEVSRRASTELLAPSRALSTRLPLGPLPVEVQRAHRALIAAGPPPLADPVSVRLYPTVADEVTAIADALRRAHLVDGLGWSQMAVLVRSGVRSIPVLRRALVAAGVPVSVAADEVPVARDPAAGPLLSVLRVAADGPTALTVDLAQDLLLSPLGRGTNSLLRALGRRLRALDRAAGAPVARPSAVLMRDAVADPRMLAGVEERFAEPALRVAALVEAARASLASEGAPDEALWAVWAASGWGRRLESASQAGGSAGRSADRDLDAVLALFETASRLEDRRPRAGVSALFEELDAQEIPAAAYEERRVSTDAVRLLTAHRAKGLEWDLVVVAGVQEGSWPDLRRRGSLLEADRLDIGESRAAVSSQALLIEERRLFYVALTRARRRLVLTAVSSLDDDGERPSRFLSEIGLDLPSGVAGGGPLLSAGSLVARLRRSLTDPEAPEAQRAAAAHRLAALAAAVDAAGRPLLPGADPREWWGLAEVTPGVRPVRPPDEPLELSASAAASYHGCPLRWFLQREVHAAVETSAAQGFGTVLHALAQAVGDGDLPPSEEEVLGRLDTVWAGLGFEAPWLAVRERAEAAAALGRFLRWHLANPREVVGTELAFRVAVGEGVVLRGQVDRLERDTAGKVHVVDLKTTRNPAPDKDAVADPQLGVYQVAVREGAFAEQLGGAADVGGAELLQLRGDRRGVPRVQSQPALEGAPSWADDVVQAVAQGIRAEEFPARPSKACTHCPYRGVCPAQDAGAEVIA